MPNRPVTVRRWEVAVGIAVYLAVLAATLTLMERRIDQAEKRIRANAVTNEQQDEVRRALLVELRKTDLRACRSIEGIKTEFRTQAIQNFARLEENARLLDVPLTPELRREALRGRNRTLARFAAREC